MSDEWKKQIAIAFMIKQKIAEVDSNGLWLFTYPNLAATEEKIENAESALTGPLSSDYRDFLKCANGWDQFYQRVNLFGTDDFIGSTRMNRALGMIQWLIEDGSWDGTSDALVPIAASIEDNTLFCLSTAADSQKGRVLWFSGRLIESFDSFTEFFMAICDYNRLEVQNLINDYPRDRLRP